MKKIIGLTIAALLIIGLVGGGTFAYFSDTEASNGNTLTAGTLNLINVISGTALSNSMTITERADGLIDKVEFGLTDPIKPGSSGTITWTLSNTGSMSGNTTMLAATTFGEGAAPNDSEMAADPTDLVGLGQKLMVWVTRGGTDILGATGGYVAMSGLAAALNLENQSIAAGDSLVYVLHWQVPTSTGNEIQGDTATLDITFTLTQN
jgi:spore coat-associated protein N